MARGATLHGLNDIILQSGLSVDYHQVSEEAEKTRSALNHADAFEVDFVVHDKHLSLSIHCAGQEAQKSHGLCLGDEPDVANLPAGEVYFVPRGAEGQFPMKYKDGTIGCMDVQNGKIMKATLLNGDQQSLMPITQNSPLTLSPEFWVSLGWNSNPPGFR